jgi:hypothetical protein
MVYELWVAREPLCSTSALANNVFIPVYTIFFILPYTTYLLFQNCYQRI